MMEGKSIGNLLGGVSQQPPSQRFPNMAEESINTWPSIVEGLDKRRGTDWLTTLLGPGVNTSDFRLHLIERDAGEQYALVFYLDGATYKVKAFDINPNSAWYKQELDVVDGAGAANEDFYNTYLNTPLPNDLQAENMQLLTVGDATFIVNRNKEITLSPATSVSKTNRGLITVRQGSYGQHYAVGVDAVSYPVNYSASVPGIQVGLTPDGSASSHSKYISPEHIAGRLQTALSNGYTSVKQTGVDTYELRTINTSGGGFSLDLDYRLGSTTVAAQVTTTPNVAWNVGPANLKASIDTALPGSLSVVVTALNPSYPTADYGFELVFSSPVNGESILDVGENSNTFATTPLATSRRQNVISISRNDSAAFDLVSEDSTDGLSVSIAKDEVTSATELPVTGWEGLKLKVNPGPETGDDDYYVIFESNTPRTMDEGVWRETIGFDLQYRLEAMTMPQVVYSKVDDAAGTITGTPYKPYFLADGQVWADREVGDENTNAVPSLFSAHGRIEGLAYFRGRLILYGGDAVAMSEAGAPFNFFRTTVAGGLIDSDRIDLISQLPTAASFRGSVQIQGNMVLMSDIAQVKVDPGAETLTPSTAGLTQVSRYQYDSGVAPVGAEFFAYFPFSRGRFAGVRQYWDASNGAASLYRAVDVTGHVNHYIPGRIVETAASTAVNTLAVVAEDRDAIYFYKWEDNGNDRVQSAWFKATFADNVTILGVGFVGSRLYIAKQYTTPNSTDLEVIDLADGQTENFGWDTIRLDRKITQAEFTTFDYDAPSNLTRIILPYGVVGGEKIQFVEAYENGQAGGQYFEIEGFGTSGPFFVAGDWTGKKLYAGSPYEMLHTLSPLFLEGPSSGGGAAPEITGRTQIRRVALDVGDSGYFKTTVTRRSGGLPSVEEFTHSSGLETIQSFRGTFKVPILAMGDGFSLTISNDSPYPSRFNSLEYQLTHRSRSRRSGR